MKDFMDVLIYSDKAEELHIKSDGKELSPHNLLGKRVVEALWSTLMGNFELHLRLVDDV